MSDDFEEGLLDAAALEGTMPPAFRRVFIAGQEEPARRDAIALVLALADRTEMVTPDDVAELIAIGSPPGGTSGRAVLGRDGRALLEGARCPVAVATLGLAEHEGYGLRRIDVGIDGGREAAAALSMAARLARAHDARLRLIAVVELRFDPAGTALPVDPHEPKRLARHLERAAEGLPGLRVEAELREGLADQIVAGLARQADLLVLGSRTTYGDAGRVSLGGIADRILRAAPCPTLVVPAP